MNDPRPIIAAVRDGRGLTPEAASRIARGLASGDLSDAQAGAFAMAVLLNGLDEGGRVALTCAMRDSGQVLSWDLPGPVIDKHSTGGVGDTVSLILAPLLAARGAYVPMISGRGLGHTGGTLDKLESIPGLRVDHERDALDRILRSVGCAIVAPTGAIAPADRRLYAIRDESATVGSIDLITASILSKKLAAGLGGLVLDVKDGSGAFLPGRSGALARALVATANGAGCPTTALVTDMDQPLARSAGNALEVAEAIRVLRGEPGALRDLTLALSAEALRLAGLNAGGLAETLDSGAAAEIFGRMVAAQGGPADLMDRPDAYLGTAPVLRTVCGPPGLVAAIDVTALGHAVVALGGGRVRAGDRIDPRVGLTGLARLGAPSGTDAPLAVIHAASEDAADRAEAAIRRALTIGTDPVAPGPLIRERIAQDD